MVKLPIQAFHLKDYEGNFIKLIIDEVFGFPVEISYGGGYGAKGLLEIKIDGYKVNAYHNFTTGELYNFLCQLKEKNNNFCGKVDLDNVDSELEMTLVFNKYGQVQVSGEFQARPDKETKLVFEMTTDQTVIGEMIKDLEKVYSNFGGIEGIRSFKD